MSVEIRLTSDELDDIVGILRFASDSDRRLSNVCAIIEDGEVNWVCTDNHCLAVLTRGSSSVEVGRLAIPKRDFLLAAEICRARSCDAVRITTSDDRNGHIYLPGITMSFISHPGPVVEIAEAVTKYGGPDRHFEVDRADLAAVLHAASTKPAWLDMRARKRFWLQTVKDQGYLEACSEWMGHPATRAAIACVASNDAVLVLEPSRILDAISIITQARIRVNFAGSGDAPIWIHADDGASILLMPQQSALESMRPDFERIFAEILEVRPSSLLRDSDGDYPINLRSGATAYVRLEADDAHRFPSRIVIFMALTDDIEESVELCRR